MRTYGRNYKAIAEAMGTKTENHLKSFYSHYRLQYNLDAVLAEYDAEHCVVIELSDEDDDDDEEEVSRF